MEKTCFVCTEYVLGEKTENLELTNPSPSSKLVSFFLRKILGIPTSNLEKISAENYFDQIVYCATCLERILYIQDILQELERLEKTLLEEKYLLESKLKESSAKSLSDSANSSTICIQQLRAAFVAEWKESVGGDPSRFEEIVEEKQEDLNQNDPFVHLTQLDLHVKSEMMGTQPNPISVSDSDPLAVSDSVLEQNRTLLPGNTYPGSSKSKDDESTFVVKDYTLDSNNIIDKHCELCAKIFSTKEVLKIHIQTVHQKKYKFKCSLCDFGSERMSDFNYHMTLHTKDDDENDDSKDFQCNHCPKKFSSERLLKIHTKFGHAGAAGGGSLLKKKKNYPKTPKKCDECGRILASKFCLKNHVLMVHRKEFKYKCQQCDYGTLWLYNLNRHINTFHKK